MNGYVKDLDKQGRRKWTAEVVIFGDDGAEMLYALEARSLRDLKDYARFVGADWIVA
jgi:hypothetical protein